MKTMLYAGLVAGAMFVSLSPVNAQSLNDSWAPAGAAAADPGSAPTQIHQASGTDGFLSMPLTSTVDSGAGDSDSWAPAGAAAADMMRPRIVASMGKEGWL